MTAAVDERRRALAGVTRQAAPPARRPLRLLPPDPAAVDLAAADKREAFRRRWVAVVASDGLPSPLLVDELAVKARVAVLFERLGEAVQDVEDGRADLLPDALGGALAAIDRLDAVLSDIESWIVRLATQQGVTLPARDGRE